MKTRTFAFALLATLLASTPLAGGEVSVGRFAPGETLAPFAVAHAAGGCVHGQHQGFVSGG